MNTDMNTSEFIMEKNNEKDAVTHDMIGAAFEVQRVLGYGFLDHQFWPDQG